MGFGDWNQPVRITVNELIMSVDLKHTCHECGGRISYPDHAKGMEIICPHCRKSTSLGEVYPANPSPQPVVSASVVPPGGAVGTVSGNTSSAGLVIAGRRIGWPVWVCVGLLVTLGSIGLFLLLRPINVAGQVYVVTKNNSVVNIPDTEGFVLTDMAMQLWVSVVNRTTSEYKVRAEREVMPMMVEHNATTAKMDELKDKEVDTDKEREVLVAKADELLRKSGWDDVDKFGLTIAEMADQIVGGRGSPIRTLIAHEAEVRKNAIRVGVLQVAASFELETNLLRHASNIVAFTKANHKKIYDAYRLQGESVGELRPYDVRTAYELAVKATNTFLGISNILARAEELRPVRVGHIELLQVVHGLPPYERVSKGFQQLLFVKNQKSRQIAKIVNAANSNIEAYPSIALNHFAALAQPGSTNVTAAIKEAREQHGKRETDETVQKLANQVWTFKTDVEGKMTLRLPKRDTYHFIAIVKHGDEHFFFHKRCDLTQGREHKVVLNQRDNSGRDTLGLKVHRAESPTLKKSIWLEVMSK